MERALKSGMRDNNKQEQKEGRQCAIFICEEVNLLGKTVIEKGFKIKSVKLNA